MLPDKVCKTISEYSMLENGDKVLCAVSGGADSVCLLYVMLSLKEEYNLSLYVANVNHLIRGEEATRDSEFVKKLCKEHNIECFYREYDIPEISKERKIGEEECGRKLRYEFFEEISEKLGGVKIATAHNLNDNAETFLFRLVRGSSPHGLSGIRHVRGNIIRPLLDATRSEIEEYLTENKIVWCEDSTNRINLYSRNKLRNTVIPHLEEIFAGAQKRIVTCSKLIKEDNEFLKQFSEKILSECFSENSIFITPLKNTHISVVRRVMARVLELWGAKEVTYEKINSFIEFVFGENGKLFDINSCFFAEKSYDKVYRRERAAKEDFSSSLTEVTPCERNGWSLKLYISEKKVKKKNNDIAIFDAEKITPPLTVRYRKEGDRIALSGLGGSKKISDIFTDEKLEHKLREITPIVEKGQDILFLCGLRQSALYNVDSSTKKYLVIEYKRNS